MSILFKCHKWQKGENNCNLFSPPTVLEWWDTSISASGHKKHSHISWSVLLLLKSKTWHLFLFGKIAVEPQINVVYMRSHLCTDESSFSSRTAAELSAICGCPHPSEVRQLQKTEIFLLSAHLTLAALGQANCLHFYLLLQGMVWGQWGGKWEEHLLCLHLCYVV